MSTEKEQEINAEKIAENLIDKIREHRLYYKRLNEKVPCNCEFISCKDQAVLHLEGFNVCVPHGLKLVKLLTEKMSI